LGRSDREKRVCCGARRVCNCALGPGGGGAERAGGAGSMPPTAGTGRARLFVQRGSEASGEEGMSLMAGGVCLAAVVEHVEANVRAGEEEPRKREAWGRRPRGGRLLFQVATWSTAVAAAVAAAVVPAGRLGAAR